MKLFCITYRGKPVTANTLRKLNNLDKHYAEDLDRDFTEAIVRKTKALAIKAYLYSFGFTWRERPKGIEVTEISVRQAEEGSKRHNGKRHQEKSVSNSNSKSAYKEAVKAVELFQLFFDKMPKGQLGKIVCDIGILNEAFIQARKVINTYHADDYKASALKKELSNKK